MAAFTEIAAIRLSLKDPLGPIRFETYEDLEHFPTPLVLQTCYHAQDTGYYYVPQDVDTIGDPVELMLSDERIGDVISAYGASKAACRLVYDIMATLGQRLLVAKDSTGAESVEYANLTTQMNYYKALREQCENDLISDGGGSTGRYGSSPAPTIAGGDL